ncbi:hypothetical protein GH714_012389 [Hevea brasiliensis]|uniref:Uncharacterized protein n=1 Tax=Hevea brasiliensis TaxID=3981 RepID=A0A6A6MIK8_HEVBR|nr:hypothetical protein GH714_012389 [Hevea brasiliensis]
MKSEPCARNNGSILFSQGSSRFRSSGLFVSHGFSRKVMKTAEIGGIPRIKQRNFSRFWFSIRSKLSFGKSKVCEENKNQDSESSNQQDYFSRRDDRNLCREEVEMVMGKLGLFCSAESEELKESMGSDELSQLFDEKEPSLEEVKKAFDVFDEKRWFY